MSKILRYLLQVLAYAGFAIVVGYLSFWPRYQYAAPDHAVVKISFSHAAERVKPCVRLTPQQIAELAPNMRPAALEQCERQRLPLVLELDVDGEAVLRLNAAPSGLWEDGPASVYKRFDLPAGAHAMSVRMRDSARTDGWDYTLTEEVTLQPGRYLTVTFKAETGGFSFR